MAPERRAGRLLANLDLVALALALPVFLAAGFPLLGYAGAGGAWIAQRLTQAALARRAAASGSPRGVAGLLAVSMVGRVWLVALAVLATGLVERKAGLPAAVLAAVLFQVHLTGQMVARSLEAPKAAR